MTRAQRIQQKVEGLVEAFNERHPVGTPVRVVRDDGRRVETKTRSTAWVLSGHSAVILLEGISGCYNLICVTPLTAPAQGVGIMANR